jgi:hypothetical protein
MKTLLHFLAITKIHAGNLPTAAAGEGATRKIFLIVFAIAGAFSLLMLTVSGLRYTLSGSNTDRVKKARNGIVYSLVGLAIAISAEAIVAFVVNRL